MEFKGQTVLVTGATGGIGSACAEHFARQGADLILFGRDSKKLQVLEKKITLLQSKAKAKGTVQIAAFDITDEKALAIAFKSVTSLDVAVNNAGFEGAIGEIGDVTLGDFDQCMNINVRAVFSCMQKEVSFFRKKKKPGRIINISSIAGLIALPTSSLYVAAKHAVNGLTKTVAIEQIKHGIRVNAVCPGGVETAMLKRIFPKDFKMVEQSTPLGRIAQPAEIAETVAWLASEKSSFVVGHCLVADGGRTV